MKNHLMWSCFATSLLLCGVASAQTIGFTATGTASGSTGSGTATLTPGGAATLGIAVRDTQNDNCEDTLQLTLTVSLTNGDVLVLRFDATGGSETGNTQIINGTLLAVEGGKGAFANLGGTGTMTITASNAANSTSFTSIGTVTMGGPLTVKANIFPSAVRNVFSDTARLSPGSWASVFGSALANATVSWNGDFPTSLGNVTGTLDGKPIYLWFVSPGQINFQVPDGTKTGCASFVLNTPNGTATRLVEVQGASPSFSMLDDKYVAGVILTPNGSGAYGDGSYDLVGPVGRFAYKTRPVKRGESLVLFGVGFGPSNPAVPAGKAFSGSARSVLTWNVGINTSLTTGVPVPVSFVGIVGAGLYQLNLTIPQNAPFGEFPVTAFLPGANNGLSTQRYPTLVTIGQ